MPLTVNVPSLSVQPPPLSVTDAQMVAALTGEGYTVTQAPPPPPPTIQTAPPGVTGLKAALSGSTVGLTWTNNGTTAAANETDGVRIYRNGAVIAWPLGATSYPDTTPGTGQVTYAVQPYNGAGLGPLTTVIIQIGTTPPPPPPPSALTMGIYNGGLSSAEALAQTLGYTAPKGFSTYCTGSTWASIAGYTPPQLPAGWRLLLGLNMDPDGGIGDLQTEANIGTFQQVARNLLAAKLELPPILRPGWEPDGNWFSWGNGINGNTPASYSAAYRAIVLAMRAIYPGLLFDLSFNTGTSNLAQLQAFYPGDDVVDVLGGDHYDKTGGGNDFSAFGPVVNLAHLHNKPVSAGEIGLKGTDDPTFIDDFAQFALNPTAAAARYGWPPYTPAYVSWFNLASLGTDITAYPNSEARFKVDFG